VPGPDPLSTDDKQKILGAFLEHEPFYYPFIRVQFETGMRPNETVALDWFHINTDARTIRIDKSRYLNADNDHPKTTHSGRTITVSRALIDLIVTLRHAWSSETDKVFLNKFGNRSIQRRSGSTIGTVFLKRSKFASGSSTRRVTRLSPRWY